MADFGQACSAVSHFSSSPGSCLVTRRSLCYEPGHSTRTDRMKHLTLSLKFAMLTPCFRETGMSGMRIDFQIAEGNSFKLLSEMRKHSCIRTAAETRNEAYVQIRILLHVHYCVVHLLSKSPCISLMYPMSDWGQKIHRDDIKSPASDFFW